VARDYKFKADDDATLTSLSKRLEFLIKNNLKDKFGDIVPGYRDEREQTDHTN